MGRQHNHGEPVTRQFSNHLHKIIEIYRLGDVGAAAQVIHLLDIRSFVRGGEHNDRHPQAGTPNSLRTPWAAAFPLAKQALSR